MSTALYVLIGGLALLAVAAVSYVLWTQRESGEEQAGVVVVTASPPKMVNPPLPKIKTGYDGGGRTVLQHIEDKTHRNRYAVDFTNRKPLAKLQGDVGCDHIQSTAWPLAGACQPTDEPPHRGLNATEVVQGENSMRLYTTYSVCPGELDARFMAQQF